MCPLLLTFADQAGFALAGFTTEVAIATGKHDPLLPRLDTNDLPTRGDAAVVEWTVKAASDNIL